MVGAATVMLYGCAENSTIKPVLAKLILDPDAKLGTPVQSTVLDDKRKATLRQNERHFFVLKVDGMNPITIGGADSAKIFHQANLFGINNILVERNDKRCPFHYQLISIQGTKVSSWPVGSCTEIPIVTMPDKSKVNYLFATAKNGFLTKTLYRFTNGNLSKDVQTTKIGLTPAVVAKPRNEPPTSSDAPTSPQAFKPDTPLRPKIKPDTPKTKPLIFKETEEKATNVDLKE